MPPEAAIEDNVATLPGLDGRKMSKSYDNTIPLFAPREQLKKLIAGILTDSTPPGQAKNVEGSALFQIYQAFASDEETAALRQAYANGIGWGEAKDLVFERIDREITPMRQAYFALMNDPAKIEAILLAGAEKARKIATPFMGRLRHAVGLRDLRVSNAGKATKAAKVAKPVFKQYRESDGKFYFKLLDAEAGLLLQSLGFDSPKDAGQTIGLLQTQGVSALAGLSNQLQGADALNIDDIGAALTQMAQANQVK